MNIGWICPQCGSAHAPNVLTCPHPKFTQIPTAEETPHQRDQRLMRECSCRFENGGSGICGCARFNQFR